MEGNAGWTPPAFMDWLPGDLGYDIVTEDIPKEVKVIFDAERERGVSPFFDYYGVYLSNPVGGREKSAQYAQEIIFGVELSLQRLLGIPDASIIVSGGQGSGRNLSDWIGNDIGVNEAYTQQTIALFNLVYKQRFLNDKLEFRIGRMAPGQVFASLPAFGMQVNSGINGNPNGLYTNIPFKTSSSSSWAAYGKYLTPHDTYVSSGIYQVGPKFGKRTYHGLNMGFSSNDGFLMMFEAGWLPTFGKTDDLAMTGKDGKKAVTAGNPGLPGAYAIGGYWCNYEFSDYFGGQEDNAYGFYAMGQQMVWRSHNNPDHNFSVWGGLTYAPQQNINFNTLFGFAGTVWQGIIPGRDEDSWLLTMLIGNYGDNYSQSLVDAGAGDPTVECVLETSYVVQLTENLSFQPDLQYVIRPGGTGNIPNALVIGFQMVAQF